MTKTKTKSTIRVFPKLETLKLAAVDACCACSCTDSMPRLDDTLTEISERRQGEVYVIIADYSPDRALTEAIEQLNAALEASGQTLRVGKDNLKMFMAQAAPVITIEGRIVCVARPPTADQLEHALETGEPIDYGPSCC